MATCHNIFLLQETQGFTVLFSYCVMEIVSWREKKKKLLLACNIEVFRSCFSAHTAKNMLELSELRNNSVILSFQEHAAKSCIFVSIWQIR